MKAKYRRGVMAWRAKMAAISHQHRHHQWQQRIMRGGELANNGKHGGISIAHGNISGVSAIAARIKRAYQ